MLIPQFQPLYNTYGWIPVKYNSKEFCPIFFLIRMEVWLDIEVMVEDIVRLLRQMV